MKKSCFRKKKMFRAVKISTQFITRFFNTSSCGYVISKGPIATHKKPHPNSEKQRIGREKWHDVEFPDTDKIITDFIKSNKDLSNVDNFRRNTLSQLGGRGLLTETSFDASFIRGCVALRNYQMGRLYFKKLESEGKEINLATLTQFIQLSFYCKSEVDSSAELEKLCRQLQSRAGEFLDHKSKERLILGLSITESWQDAMKIFREDQMMQTSPVLTALIQKLLENDLLDDAESLMETAVKQERVIIFLTSVLLKSTNQFFLVIFQVMYDSTYESWINKCYTNPRAWDFLSNLLARYEIFPNQVVTEKLKEMLKKRSLDAYSGVPSTINKATGSCRSCGRVLQNLSISPAEFDELKEVTVKKILIEPDVFIGSTPEEVARFKRLVEKTGPYNVVIDGLNVAYMYGRDTPPRKRMQAVSDSSEVKTRLK